MLSTIRHSLRVSRVGICALSALSRVPVAQPAAPHAARYFSSSSSSSSSSASTSSHSAHAASSPSTHALFPSCTFQHLTISHCNVNNTLTVTMSRPQLHNAFNELLIDELINVFNTVNLAVESGREGNALGHLRAIVLTGAGASFSAGADLNWMKKMKNYTEAENIADSQHLFQLFYLIHSCPIVTIARLNGSALGGGVGLLSACDVGFGVASAQLGLTEVKLGLAPAVISRFVMNKIGRAAASYLFLSGQRVAAAEAFRIGLLSAQPANDEAELDAQVTAYVNELNMNSPKAVRATKRLIATVANMEVNATKSYVTGLIAKLRTSEEGQEGLTAFFEKRKPKWIPAHLGNPKKKEQK